MTDARYPIIVPHPRVAVVQQDPISITALPGEVFILNQEDSSGEAAQAVVVNGLENLGALITSLSRVRDDIAAGAPGYWTWPDLPETKS